MFIPPISAHVFMRIKLGFAQFGLTSHLGPGIPPLVSLSIQRFNNPKSLLYTQRQTIYSAVPVHIVGKKYIVRKNMRPFSGLFKRMANPRDISMVTGIFIVRKIVFQRYLQNSGSFVRFTKFSRPTNFHDSMFLVCKRSHLKKLKINETRIGINVKARKPIRLGERNKEAVKVSKRSLCFNFLPKAGGRDPQLMPIFGNGAARNLYALTGKSFNNILIT